MQALESPDKTLRFNLEAEMEKRGWKKADLARAAGLPLSTVYPLFDENQLAWPQPTTLAKLAQGLQTTVSALLGESRSVTPQEALEVIKCAIMTQGHNGPPDPLAARVSRLNPRDRQYVEDLVKGLEDNPSSPEPGQHPPERRK